MPCFKTTNTWAKQLRSNTLAQEHKLYTVQLSRHVGCCNERYNIYVNGEEVQHHTLTYNPCSPLCCTGGMYEWEQDGHDFLLMYNNLSFTRAMGGFRLFVDGIDCNTDRQFTAFWKRRGMQVMFVGLCFLIVGLALSLLLRYVVHVSSINRLYVVGYALVICGVLYIAMGCIPYFRKYNRQHRYSRQPDETLARPSENIV